MSNIYIHTEFDTFLEWVEGTSLFNAIKEMAGKTNASITTNSPEGLTINLNPNVKINSARELPKEVLLNFFRNSPWWIDPEDIHTTEVRKINEYLINKIENYNGNSDKEEA